MSQMQPQQHSGPPYASPNASPGGLPGVIPDVPISAVFIIVYLSFAITNMTILQINLRRQHKFIISGALFGFSMSRIVTFALRIAWATHQHNVRLAIAANVFVNAGVLIVYIVNLIFAQRIFRARQPTIGWHPSLGIVLKVFYVGIGAALILVIYSVVQGAYTLDASRLNAVRSIQLAAATYLLVFTTLPLWLLLVAYFLLRKPADEELFGCGSMRTKVIINMVSTCICIIISGFKAGTAWEAPLPLSDPAWYHTKPTFYVFNFVFELLVLSLLAFSRVDKRFHIPNGSKGPGDYSRPVSERTTIEKTESSYHSDNQV
ncbi:hypothetical protein NUW58_g2580 [Xylaria curta]|uniref:Uncharacterized protein n=1 Tax=Xylaria curta TaxID=42375 RepID=A0ACC1PEU8_9PEZI|nr:hypothetical protein NUW58_g2580 [Xylaria curta]